VTRVKEYERKQDRKKYLLPMIGCLAGSVLLYAVAVMTDKNTAAGRQAAMLSQDSAVMRDSPGRGTRQIQVYVEGLVQDPVPLTVEIGAREYTREEAERVFLTVMETMEARIRGKNPSLMEVRTDLVLPADLESEGIQLRWYSSDTDLINSRGKINNTLAETEETGRMIYFTVALSDGIHKADFELPVRVLPLVCTDSQRQIEGLKQQIQKKEETQREAEVLSLPTEYEGKILHYRTKEDSGHTILLVLGGILAILCYAKVQSDVREQEKRRERELLLDYADLVSKLMIFIGAGMTMRLAWGRIVQDYETGLAAGRQKKRALYEEMSQTHYQMERGLSEGEAFRDFGRRCRLQPYLKLSSLLEQNRKSGTRNLRTLLELELADAWEQRKNLARKLGEEAGTKLLLPLFLMLGIVMVIIMVPAMMSMA